MTTSDNYLNGVFPGDEANAEPEFGDETLSDFTDRLAEGTHTSSKAIVWLGGLVSVIVLVIIGIVFWTMISTGQNAAMGSKDKDEPAATASATASAPETASAEATESADVEEAPFTLAEGRSRLASMNSTSTCQAEEDASFFESFARLSEQAGTWEDDKADVNARLSDLPGKCGETYAALLASRLRESAMPEGLRTLAETTLAYVGADKRPAPGDAIDVTSLSIPSRNIQCEFSKESVDCTIYQYQYSSDACQGQPATYSVLSSGETSQSCERQVSSGTTISYGTSAAHGPFACTANDSGIECWHQGTGRGFRLSTTGIQTF